MTNTDPTDECIDAHLGHNLKLAPNDCVPGNAADNSAVLDAEQAAFDDAMIGLGLDPRTAPRLSELRAPRPEPVPRVSPAEASFVPLTDAEWQVIKSVLERRFVSLKGVDWCTKRRQWGALLYKTTVGCTWTRLPAKFGTVEGNRKHAEVQAVAGTIEAVVASLLAELPELTDDRRAAFRGIAAWAVAKRERIESYRAGAARLASH